MGLRVVSYITLALAALAGAGGCLGSNSQSLGPFVDGGIHGFTAEGRIQGTPFHAIFSGPIVVPNVDRSPFKAYELRMEIREPQKTRTVATYLDADFHVVLERTICDQDCEHYTSWTWLTRGRLAPYGLGLPMLIRDNRILEYQGTRVIRETSVHNRLPNGTLEVEVFPSASGGNDPAPSQRFWFRPGLLLPDGAAVRVESYEVGEAIGPVDRMPEPASPVPAPWKGVMFPDEEKDTFNVGFAPLAMVRKADPDLDPTSAACVQQFWLRLGVKNGPSPLSPLQETTVATALINIVENGEMKKYEVSVHRRNLDGTLRMDAAENGTTPTSATCSAIRMSPWPSKTVAEGRSFAMDLNLSQQGITDFLHVIGVEQIYGRTSAEGWTSWNFQFKPNYVGSGSAQFWEAYLAQFEPTTAIHLEAVVAHPDDRIVK